MALHITEDEFYWKGIEVAWNHLATIYEREAYLEAFREFPQWIRDLIAVHWLLEEFDNGGLMQFFLNDTGNLAPDAVDGFRHMRLVDAAEAIVSAVALFGSEYPRDEKVRRDFLRSKIGVRLGERDLALFESVLFCPMEEALCKVGGEDLDTIYDRMNEYAREHFDGK